jgi:hypothetical protein
VKWPIHQFFGTETRALEPGRKCRSFGWGFLRFPVCTDIATSPPEAITYRAAGPLATLRTGDLVCSMGAEKVNVSGGFRVLSNGLEPLNFLRCCWSIDIASNR